MDLQPGSRVFDYEVLSVLGAGGMGKVYKVKNLISDRVEAMKVLLPDLAGQPELAERFLNEIKVLASLQHPHIAALHTALRTENQLLMIMEFVEGLTLSERLQQGPLPVGEAAGYLDQALDALGFAHQRGVIHRDIKPANMMLTRDGNLKLMDFGIAKASTEMGLTRTGTTLGSLYYISPEQLEGKHTDSRSDLYSLGVSAYEIFTGKRPFDGTSEYSLMTAHLLQQPRPLFELNPGLPKPLSDVILMALAKDPEQRFQSAEAFRNALRAAAQGQAPMPENILVSNEPPPVAEKTVLAGIPLPMVEGTTLSAAPLATPLFEAAPTEPIATNAGAFDASSVGMATPASVAAASPAATSQPTATPFGSQAPRPSQTASAQPVTAQSAAVQPSITPPVPAASETRPSPPYRGLYMTAGAMVAVLVMIGAAMELPRWYKTRAAHGTAVPAEMPSPVVNQPQPQETGGAAGALPSGTAGSAQSSNSAPAGSANVDHTNAAGAGTSNPAGGAANATRANTSHPTNRKAFQPGVRNAQPGTEGQASASATTSQQNPTAAGLSSSAQPASQPAQTAAGSGNGPAGNAAAVAALQDRMDKLAARANAIKSTFQNMQQQEAASGLGLRPDVVASENLMEGYMDKADAALAANNSQSAAHYMDLAEKQISRLEAFFGR